MSTPNYPHFGDNGSEAQEINILALVKGAERYVFLYHDQYKREVLRTLGRFAGNPELSFNWHDAAVLSQRMKVQADAPSSEFKLSDTEAPLIEFEHLGDDEFNF